MSVAPGPLPQVILTDEQAAAIRSAGTAQVELLTSGGERVGVANVAENQRLAWSHEQLEAARVQLAKAGRYWSAEELRARLQVISQGDFTSQQVEQAKTALASGARRASTEEVLTMLRAMEHG